jgi:hypothetical protein
MLPSSTHHAATGAGVDASSDDWTNVRREHLGVETNIRLLGWIHLAGLAGLALPSLLMPDREPIFLLELLSFGLMELIAIHYLRGLRPAGRVVATGIACLAPLLCLEHRYAPAREIVIVWATLSLIVLWSPRAQVVFSEQYRAQVVPSTADATPSNDRVAARFLLGAFVQLTLVFAIQVLMAARAWDDFK